MDCANCGHEEGEHELDKDGVTTICIGDGRFDNGDPQCDCDLFEEEEEEEID